MPSTAERDARRLGIIGAESTGKSTLARALTSQGDAVVATEALRDFVVERGRTPRIDEQLGIMREQQRREDDLARAQPDRLVVADPAALMTAIYSDAYFDDRSLYPAAVQLARGYGVVAWCDTDQPWEPEPGMRDGPGYRDRVHELIRTCVAERLQPMGIHVVLVHGTLAERVAALRRAWQTSASDPPT